MFDLSQMIIDLQRQYGLQPAYIFADMLEERGGTAVSAAAIRSGKLKIEWRAFDHVDGVASRAVLYDEYDQGYIWTYEHSSAGIFPDGRQVRSIHLSFVCCFGHGDGQGLKISSLRPWSPPCRCSGSGTGAVFCFGSLSEEEVKSGAGTGCGYTFNSPDENTGGYVRYDSDRG